TRTTSFFSFFIPPPPSSTLFPYTTLFRSPPTSRVLAVIFIGSLINVSSLRDILPPHHNGLTVEKSPSHQPTAVRTVYETCSISRSEEHTSELQSPYDLVCRLLLEKKKYNI